MEAAALPWWIWPLTLFVVSFLIGILAVIAGVGGAALFVPIVGSFFPFHLDFVRGAGLLLALSGALSAAPALLREGLASMRLAMPLALVGSIGSIAGAVIGLALPTPIVQAALGVTIIAVAALVWGTKATAPAATVVPDALGAALRMQGIFHDPASGRDVEWRAHRTASAFFAFGAIGVLAGMFGLGAGWANVPAFNLLMGLPLKLSVGTSGFLLSVVDTSAAWVYVNRGAVLPMLVAPSIIGVMLGAKIGVRLFRVAPASMVRRAVILVLLVAGVRSLLKGLGIWN